jgi:hypothetical protein
VTDYSWKSDADENRSCGTAFGGFASMNRMRL